MKKFLALTLLIIIAGIFVLNRPKTSPDQQTSTERAYEYYWGETCPHCANVQEFLDSWEEKEKINLEKKEVYNNQQNSRLLTQRAETCNLQSGQIGVPFLYTPEGECIIGDTPIINYLENLQE